MKKSIFISGGALALGVCLCLLFAFLISGCSWRLDLKSKECKIYENPPSCSEGWIKEIDGYQCIAWTDEEKRIHEWAKERQNK